MLPACGHCSFNYFQEESSVPLYGATTALTSIPNSKREACATWKWKSSRPSALPVIFKAAVEMTAAQTKNCVGSPYSPEHSRSLEAGADHSLAAGFDHTRPNKQMLAAKFRIAH